MQFGTTSLGQSPAVGKPLLVFACRTLIALMGAVMAGCSVPIKGYEGTTRPQDETALLRIITSGYGTVDAELAHPVTNNPVKGTIVVHHDRSPWMRIPAEKRCFQARSRSIRCVNLFEAIFTPEQGCKAVGPWAEQEICFDAQSGRNYEIEVRTRQNKLCMEEKEILGFWLVDANTRDVLEQYPIVNYCQISTDR